MHKDVGKQMMADSKFYMGYSRWDDEKGRYETWDESISRVMNMHREKYEDVMTDELAELISFSEDMYKSKKVLGAQRALQFGGPQIFAHNARLYNCSASYCDRPAFFQEAMYLLLAGCGVGFSVQKHHIAKLPKIKHRFERKSKVFTVPDSIEGWAEAFGVLISSYFVGGGTHPEYEGCQIRFDLTKIRPKGSLISGGFKAPGPDGLRVALQKCEDLLERLLTSSKEAISLKPITAYDFVMHMSDAVLSGGVRRSATICMFSKDDEEMLNAKTGDWFVENPQRGRSNNSVMLLRDDLSRMEWAHIMESVKHSGEPGFIFTDSLEYAYNPCLTGDALVRVRDHDVIVDGSVVAEGQQYDIRLDQLVELYNSSDLCPMILSYNTETGENEWKKLLGAAMTRENAEVFEIYDHESGKTIKATADHLIWTKNRGYVEVKNLKEDDTLLII